MRKRCLVGAIALWMGLAAHAAIASSSWQEEPVEEWIVLASIAQPDELAIEVGLEELSNRPHPYRGSMVRVKGKLVILESESPDQEGQTLELQEDLMSLPLLVLTSTPSSEETSVLSSVTGRAVEILGRFGPLGESGVRLPATETSSYTDGIVVDSVRVLRQDELLSGTEAKSESEAEDVPRPRHNLPAPRLISCYPKSGSPNIPLNTEFVLRFSTDVDPDSFEGNVRLGYADDPESSTTFPDLRLRYNRATWSLMIHPAQRLEPLKELRLTLHVGIVSAAGAPLLPSRSPSRGGKAKLRSRRSAPQPPVAEDVVVVLTFHTRNH